MVFPVSPARACALRVIRRVFERGAYADRAFAAEAAGLEPRDRALATAISYGTVQRRATLDYVAAAVSSRPLDQLEPAVLAGLRLGLFQLLFLGGVAPHAAVNETVELVKQASRGGAGFVNAVLRRALAAGPALLEQLDEDTPETAAVLHSVPRWVAELWWRELGPDTARELLRAVNEPAESALRVNLLVARVADVASALPAPSRPAPGLPEGLLLDGPFDAEGSELWRHGSITAQSRASMLVSRVLAPRPGQRVLDLCAAPGAKTTHLASLMRDQGELVAVERHPGRARALERNCVRMRAACVRVRLGDAAAPPVDGSFDRVLVDPPCSGLGTLRSRPDRRWRASLDQVAELARLQSRILAAGAARTRRDGVLVYSVCTISRSEGDDVVDRFLQDHPDFSAEHLGSAGGELPCRDSGSYLQTLPVRGATDGFFVARLRRV